MPENPLFDLRQIDDRSMVRLRVRPHGADAAARALQLPPQPLQWRDGDPAVCWLGPDQWLFTSDSKAAEDIAAHIGRTLCDQLHAATDVSSQLMCLALKGPAARTVLAMGCGIDMHPSAFKTGQCVRTNFANILLLIVAVEENRFDLYVDRSLAAYLSDWIANAGEDPITQDKKFHLDDRELAC
jgi:sarcosine oxidase subunit gamma